MTISSVLSSRPKGRASPARSVRNAHAKIMLAKPTLSLSTSPSGFPRNVVGLTGRHGCTGNWSLLKIHRLGYGTDRHTNRQAATGHTRLFSRLWSAPMGSLSGSLPLGTSLTCRRPWLLHRGRRARRGGGPPAGRRQSSPVRPASAGAGPVSAAARGHWDRPIRSALGAGSR